jgi:sialidase-1
MRAMMHGPLGAGHGTPARRCGMAASVPLAAIAGCVALSAAVGCGSTPHDFAPPASDAGDTSDAFRAGDGHPVYRIPSVVRANDGTLVAFAEGRGTLADNGSNDLACVRSSDGGRTWSRPVTILDVDRRSLNNPCAITLHSGPHAGRIVLMAQSYPTGCGEGCVQEGLVPGRDCRSVVMHSDDGGLTWSAPADVSESVKRATGATSVACGPGIGIQLRDGAYAGRLVMPFNEGPHGAWNVYVAFSDDSGATWSMGEIAPRACDARPNEVQVAECADGSLLMLSRRFGGAPQRLTARSADGGQSWTPLVPDASLPDPSCMGGLIATSRGSTLICTGPSSAAKRMHGMAWTSTDCGTTWDPGITIDAGPFAYSVPVETAPGEIGILWEADLTGTIRFTRLPLRSPP